MPDRYEHLLHYDDYYCNRSRAARRLIDNGDDIAGSIRIDEPPANTRRKTGTESHGSSLPLRCHGRLPEGSKTAELQFTGEVK